MVARVGTQQFFGMPPASTVPAALTGPSPIQTPSNIDDGIDSTNQAYDARPSVPLSSCRQTEIENIAWIEDEKDWESWYQEVLTDTFSQLTPPRLRKCLVCSCCFYYLDQTSFVVLT
jgi:hypothetical protein